MSTHGRVHFVGAGPGDPGLITVAGLDRLRHADLIVYDRLVSPRLLEHARPNAALMFVGKEGGGPQWSQDDINNLLVERARLGQSVVRLKGGDPFVFGRGGEEARALWDADVAFEIVPGVTSAVAVPAYAGIPITHRGVASSFAVLTGHEDPEKEESALSWDRLATAVDTLIILMGTRTLADTVEQLVVHGRAAETLTAVIQWGTTSDQHTVTGTLADIVARTQEAGLTAPAVVVVGDVVRLRETLSWFEGRKLLGKRVLVTRAKDQASLMTQLLAQKGAIPIELPAIEIEPLKGEAPQAAIDGVQVGKYAWTVFTSANAVDLFFLLMNDRGLDARAFARSRVAAIGPGTAQALAHHGIVADCIPTEYIAEGVVKALAPLLRSGDRVLLPRAEGARAELVDGLSALGAEVDEAILYRAAVPSKAPEEALALLKDGRIDVITFTSSSTVRNLAALLKGDVECLRTPPLACIGDITAGTVSEVLGRPADIVAAVHTVPGLVQALEERFEGI